MSTSAASGGLPGHVTVPMTPLLTVPQVAEVLGISLSKTNLLISRGIIPSLVIGDRNRRVERSALQQYIAACGATGPTGP